MSSRNLFFFVASTALLSSVVSCSHKATPTTATGDGGPSHAVATDHCQELIDKMKPPLLQIAKAKGKQVPASAFADMVTNCQKDPSVLGGKVSQCVLSAKDAAAVAECLTPSLKDHEAKSKRFDAHVKLARIGAALTKYATSKHGYPVGSAPLTPSVPCCAQTGQQCAPAPDEWTHGAWQDMGFSFDDASQFQYSYDSDGKTFTIKAVGDLQCDGHPTEIVGHGSLDDKNNPKIELPPDEQ